MKLKLVTGVGIQGKTSLLRRIGVLHEMFVRKRNAVQVYSFFGRQDVAPVMVHAYSLDVLSLPVPTRWRQSLKCYQCR